VGIQRRSPTGFGNLRRMPTTPLYRCESCGSDAVSDVDLLSVQRVYLVAPPEGTVGNEQVRVLDDIELWCFVCRSMYPHAPIEGE
jgi:hypothetical protein